MRQRVRIGACLIILAISVLLCATSESRSEETCCGRGFTSSGDTLFQISRGQLYEIVPGRMSVRFEPDAAASSIDSLNSSVTASELVTFGSGLTVLAYPDTLDPLDVLDTYCGSPLVELAELVPVAKWASNPNDTYYSSRQWDMKPSHMDACSAWEISAGDTAVVIAVIDDGILSDHEDLERALWVNWPETEQGGGSDDVDDDGNGYMDDPYGWDFHANSSDVYSVVGDHGTSVAGIADAITNNGTGVAGVAGGWGDGTLGGSSGGCRLMPVLVWPGDPTLPRLVRDP
jgi:hypothetical protein